MHICLLDLADGDPPDSRLLPDRVMPLLVLFGFPVARVVELAAVDLLVAAGAGHVDLQAADHAGAAAGHLPPAAPQRDGDARLGGGVAVVRIDLRSEEHTSELQSQMRN